MWAVFHHASTLPVTAVTDLDQTVVLPRQPGPAVTQEPREDPWVARGVAPVGGLIGMDAALRKLAWLLPTVAMATISIVRAGWSSLSADELELWGLVTTPWADLWQLRTELEAFELPYLALMKLWGELFGTADFSLRVPSLLAMTIAAALTAALVSRLVTPRAGVLAGLMFPAVPATSRYAHEVGPEALAVCLAVLSTTALVWLFDRPRWWRVLGYAGSVALMATAHGATLLVLLGHAGAVLALRRRVLLRWFVAAVIGSAPAVGLLFVGRAPWDVPLWLGATGTPTITGFGDVLFGLAALGGVVVGLGLLGMSMKKPAGIFAAAALFPLVAVVPATRATTLDLAELVLFTLPYWFCLAAMALHRVPLIRGVAVLSVIALIGIPTQLDIRADDGHGLAARDVARILNTEATVGDAIIYGPTPVDGRIGRDLVARYVTEEARPADALAEQPPRVGGQLLAQECVDVNLCLADAPRVWLFRTSASTSPLDGMPAAKDGVLRVRYTLERTWTFRGASLSLFSLNPELDRPAPR